MNRASEEILFQEEVPEDLFSTPLELVVYDVVKNASTGETVALQNPYNSSPRRWSSSPEEKLQAYLAGYFIKEDYVVRIPEMDGEKLALLAEKGGKRLLFAFALDSEAEGRISRILALTKAYKVVVVRDAKVFSQKGEVCLTVDEVLGTFNFQSL